jgi:molybdopterin-binding protein
MKISGRNQFKGIVRSVKKGAAAITAGSVDHLRLGEGDEVTVIIKATEFWSAKSRRALLTHA